MNGNIKISKINYKQNNQDYISIILPFEIIDNNSEVLIYGKDPKGYQREPIRNHINKIKEYICKYVDSFVLPTAIVLAIDENDLGFIINKKTNEFDINSTKINKNRKLFRIVDGQHRIIAMREAAVDNPILYNYQFNVIILITKSEKRSVEMEMFYDINSKGKRLKVDLIELARFNFRILEKNFKKEEINEHISIQTAYYLNEKTQKSIWTNAIKLGIHDEQVLGVIGVNAFRESIASIVDSYLKIDENSEYKKLDGVKLIEYSKKSAYKISDFIHKAWDTTIKKKWEFCFKDEETQIDMFFEPQKIYYNNKYYIQRTMGAKALNGILGSVVSGRENKKICGLNKESLSFFNKIISESNITSDDWKVGGTFSGYSSESGFKKVNQIIMNRIEINRLF